MSAANTPESAATWDERFRSGRHPWDLGRPSPLVMRLIGEFSRPPARVLVVGCGQGWEVEALLDRGFQVTGLDFAPAALGLIRDRLGRRSELTLVAGDLLALPTGLRGAYDLVVEHTCFCALPPARGSDYVEAVAAALVPGGQLIGAFMNFQSDEAEGPPHGTDANTLKSLFEPRFEIRRLRLAPEPFPPLEVPVPPQVYRVAQLEAVFQLR